MANARDIKRRIKSVNNTKKITGAMELVAASKMKRAIDGATMSRPYAKTLKDLATIITKSIDTETQNNHDDEVKKYSALGEKTLIVVIGSNRGLCGGYNTQVGRELVRYMRSLGTGNQHSFITIGKKADILIKRINGNTIASFHELPETITVRSIQPIVTYVNRLFTTGEYRAIKVLYTEFKNALSQQVYMQTLLPVHLTETLAEAQQPNSVSESITYLIEPNPTRVLEVLSARYVTSLLYQFLQESRASEHSSRMMAMRSAKDAATDMVSGLSLEYNKARQAGITREIAEISAGQLVGQTS